MNEWKEKFDKLWSKRPVPEDVDEYNFAFNNGYARAFADWKEQLIKDGLYPARNKKEEDVKE